jgi:RHS repeat-associated protein
MITDASGAEIARYDFLPFGEAWPPPQNPTDVRQFAGKERDPETKLDYFGARYLRPESALFTTVDPVFNWEQAPIDPQRWNRYSYSRNNPLRYVDPNGEDIIDIALGVVNAFGSNLALGGGRLAPANADFATGQGIGDVLAVGAGFYEMAIGGTLAAAGGMVSVTGVGVTVGAPAMAVGAVAATHGAGVAGIALAHLSKNTAESSTITSSGQRATPDGRRIGPSGKPEIHQIDSSTKKEAKDAARNAGKNAPMHHPSPKRGDPHFHPTDKKGKKLPDGTHYNYPKQ